jgi:hypothetical protein
VNLWGLPQPVGFSAVLYEPAWVVVVVLVVVAVVVSVYHLGGVAFDVSVHERRVVDCDVQGLLVV